MRARVRGACERLRARRLTAIRTASLPARLCSRFRDDGEAHQQSNKSSEKVDELLEAREADEARRDDEDNLNDFEGLAPADRSGLDSDETDDEA